MWSRLRRFRELPRAAKAEFLRAALVLPLITITLRVRGFRATQRFLQTRLRPAIPALIEAAAEEQTQRVCRAILAAVRLAPIPYSCLERSLALWWLLARRGIASQLRIGARKGGGQFEAHAWVERNGVAIGEPEGAHAHYAAFSKEFSGELS